MNKRNPSFQNHQFGISFLRVLATFSVIVIHVSGPLVVKFGDISLFDWNLANFFDSISRYSVPMFFMISGALLLDKDYDLIYFLKRRFGKILPPFLIWSLIYSLFNRYALNDEVFNISKVVKDIFYGSEYHLWFVYALLGVYLMTPVLRKWIKHTSQKEILYVLIIWLFTLIIKIPGFIIYFPKIDLTYFSGFIGYFILGYYLSKIKFQEKLISILLVLLGVIVTIVATWFFTIKNSIFYEYFYEYLSLNTLMVSIGVFILFKKMNISNEQLNSIVLKLSECCFGIYLIHPLVLKLFNLIGYNVYILSPIISVLMISLTCFICSFFIISCFKKLKLGYLVA